MSFSLAHFEDLPPYKLCDPGQMTSLASGKCKVNVIAPVT